MTNATDTIGIGIIGAGWFGERHAAALAQAGGFRLVASCRDDAAGLDAFTRRFGGRGHRTVDALLADRDVDAVVIATPHDLHATCAIAAARAGKPILLEKPMAPTLSACDAIATAASVAGVPLMVGHTQRFASPVVAARSLLRSGALGRVRYGSSSMVKLWMEPNRKPWHMTTASGGGMLMTAGIHALDRLLWLFDASPRTVYAVAGASFHEQEADDSAMMLLTFDGGAAATVTSIAYRDGAPFGGTELVCDEGVLVLDPSGALRVGRAGRWQDVSLPPSADVMADALVEEWRTFGRVLRSGAPNPADAASARRTIACIVAALESARTGTPVVVDHGPSGS
ncbi:Gfo/Idh/MocA family protein [Alsobacter sp. R-9]